VWLDRPGLNGRKVVLVIAPSRHSRTRRGQGNTEYIIIVALIAIAAIGIITLFGDNIRNLFGASADSLGGDDDIANRGTQSNAGLTDKNMSNFAMQNSAYDPGGSQNRGGAPSGNGAQSAAGPRGGAM
jgi:Flp pilus assembly pilin Flp